MQLSKALTMARPSGPIFIGSPRQKTIGWLVRGGVVMVDSCPKGLGGMPKWIFIVTALFAVYFPAALLLKQSDPILISPKVDGKIVHLRQPFLPQYGFGTATPDYWFGAVADSDSDTCRSTIQLYENEQRLGPMHVDRFEVDAKGMGRGAHWRTDDSRLLYGGSSMFMISSSDTSDPNTNGRSYWAVVPRLNAITCPDLEPHREPEFLGKLPSGEPPRLAVRLKNFEVSPTSSLVVSHEIQQLEEIADTPDEKRSPVLLYENDRLLGPAHSIHKDIAQIGLGRYSHWGKGMVFSTSDNSDPNTNGRKYWAVVPF
jgi:hypothetical protein